MPNQTVKTLKEVDALKFYPADQAAELKNATIYYTDGTSQTANFASVSRQVESLTAQLTLLNSIKSAIATTFSITE